MINKIKKIRIHPLQRRFLKFFQFRICLCRPDFLERKKDSLQCFYPVIVNSVPKAGTNLAVGILSASRFFSKTWNFHLPSEVKGFETYLEKQKPGQVISLHSQYSTEKRNLYERLNKKMIFVIRDPRDIIVSNVYYISFMDKSHPAHSILKSANSMEEKFVMAINGFKLGNESHAFSVAKSMRRYCPWISKHIPFVHVVRFEDIASRSLDVRMDAIYSMLSFCGIDDESIKADFESLNYRIGTSRTFRRGLSGSWKNEFTPKVEKLFYEKFWDTMNVFGYE